MLIFELFFKITFFDASIFYTLLSFTIIKPGSVSFKQYLIPLQRFYNHGLYKY